MKSSLSPTFGGIQDVDNPPEYHKKSSTLDVAAASFELSFKSAETASIGRFVSQKIAESEDDVTDHHELNKIYRLPTPLNKPMSKARFDKLVKEDIDRKELMTIISKGSGSAVEKIASFGASMGAQAIDPIGIAMGMGVGTLATKVLAKSVHAGIKGKSAIGLGQRIAEGVTGNLIAEGLIVSPVSQAEQQDVDTKENLMNALYGGIGFPVALKGIGLGVKGLSKMLHLTEQRMNSGKKPFGSPLEREAVTGEIRAKLSSDRIELETKLETLEDENEIFSTSKEIEEIDAQLKQLEQDLDPKKLREESNSRENDMYYDEQARREVEEFREDETIKPISSKVDEEFEQMLAGEDLAEGKSSLLNEKELHIQRRQALPEAADIAANCLFERFSGGNIG